jgi:hypothetical protein
MWCLIRQQMWIVELWWAQKQLRCRGLGLSQARQQVQAVAGLHTAGWPLKMLALATQLLLQKTWLCPWQAQQGQRGQERHQGQGAQQGVQAQ